MKKSLNATRNTLRVAAVQMKSADSIEGNLAKIEQATSQAAQSSHLAPRDEKHSSGGIGEPEGLEGEPVDLEPIRRIG